jgi:beta-lactamase regulating signal transducer with metallopeptidase domain
MPPSSEAWLSWGADRLIAGSMQGAIAAAAVWLICRRMTTIPAAVRAMMWWVVSLKLALSFVSLPSFGLPLLPAERIDIEQVAAPSTTLRPAIDLSASRSFAPPPASRETAPASHARWWLTFGMGVWLAGISVHAVRLLSAFARLRRTLRRSTPIGDEDAAIADRAARLLGLHATPDVRVSDRIETPLVAGFVRPVVLLPAHAVTTLSQDERAMAIGHELAHVRRRDLLFGWVPAVAERLFFFHPLARLAAREYAAEREAACDALVLKAMDVTPHDYGRMLVRLGVSVLDPVFTAGGSSPSRSSLRRRLDMLHDGAFTRSGRGVIALLTTLCVLALVPLHLVAMPSSASAVAEPLMLPGAAPGEREQAPGTQPPQETAPSKPSSAPKETSPTARRNVERAREAVAAQQLREAQLEAELKALRAQLEMIAAQDEALQKAAAEAAARRDADRAAMLARLYLERKQAEEQPQVEKQRTDQVLEAQLKALVAEQEKMSASLRVLAEQIEQIRRQVAEQTSRERVERVR